MTADYLQVGPDEDRDAAYYYGLALCQDRLGHAETAHENFTRAWFPGSLRPLTLDRYSIRF